MAQLLYANQFIITTLNVGGGIDNSQTTGIIISSVSGIDTSKPGIALLNYADPLNTSTAEWIEYTSIDGSKELQGVTRGAEGYSAKAHDNSVQVAFPLSESHINRINEKLNGNDTIDADIDLGDTYNILYNSADPYRTITLPAKAWAPTTTSGCAAADQSESTTNKINYDSIDFDSASDEKAYVTFQMPDSWDAGTVQYRLIWSNASGLTTETINFTLGGRSFADDDAIDQAIGTTVAVTDTWIAQGDIHQTSWSSAITLAGTPAAGEWVYLELMRDVSEDNLTGDAQVIAVQVRYKQAQFGD